MTGSPEREAANGGDAHPTSVPTLWVIVQPATLPAPRAQSVLHVQTRPEPWLLLLILQSGHGLGLVPIPMHRPVLERARKDTQQRFPARETVRNMTKAGIR